MEFKNSEAISVGPAEPVTFCCPVCKGTLKEADGALSCASCGARWPVSDGIPCFLTTGELPEYQLSADMAGLVRQARALGWRLALEEHLGQAGKRRAYAQEYVSSEARADFRFLMQLPEQPTVLDIGSGWGNIAVAFARQARQVFAIDTTLPSLQFVQERAAQEGLTNVLPAVGDAVTLPLLDGCCDAVLMVGVLEWVAWGRIGMLPEQAQQAALNEAYRVLKPGGQLYIGIENRYSIKSFLGFREPHTSLRFISLLPRSLAQWYSHAARRRPFREYTYSEAELTRRLRDAGFVRVERYYPLPSYQNFRYIAPFDDLNLLRYLVTRLQGHGRFTGAFGWAIRLGVELRLHRALAPCFAFLAAKEL